MKRNALVIKEQDNVATAIKDIAAGEEAIVGCGEKNLKVKVLQDIVLGHKFAVRTIETGEDILKYNCVIGRATRKINVGEHAHIHNLESLRGRGDLV